MQIIYFIFRVYFGIFSHSGSWAGHSAELVNGSRGCVVGQSF